MPKKLLLFSALFVAGLSCADFLSPWIDMRLEMLAHFKFQFSLLLAFLMVLLYCAQRKFAARLVLAVMLLNAVQLSAWYWPAQWSPQAQAAQSSPQSFSLLQANVYYHNQDSQALAQLIQTEQPDIVILQEANAAHFQRMQAFRLQYPYRLKSPPELKIGHGIWSRYPIAHGSFRLLQDHQLPALSGEFLIAQRALPFLTTHLTSPVRQAVSTRNQQLRAVEDYIVAHPQTQLLLGDFNISMWSPQYKALERQTGLRNCRRGFGILPSWPAQMPQWARIPIDQCLVGQQLQVQRMEVGEPIGSDHLPLLMRFALS